MRPVLGAGYSDAMSLAVPTLRFGQVEDPELPAAFLDASRIFPGARPN